MSGERVVVVGDAHLGSADIRDEEAFHEFLDAVPSLGDRLLVMGDLFDFWFEYRAVIPRRPFKTLAKLAVLLEKGVPVEMFGGNHDRWGGTFWGEDLKIPFHAEGTDLVIAGRTAHVAHGDGLAEQTLGGKLIHRITRSRFTIGAFKALHPDFAFKLADRLSGGLAESNKSPEAMDAAAAAQETWARALMDSRPDLGLVVLAHTHRQRLLEVAPGRFYLNAGQWMVDRAYAVVGPETITPLRWPARP
ncbi:MAG: UDP-2,3-diacylglucosamine diphosphatase [Gemmatimonadales bacterium]|nr:UDP-2,3-diacylglucosamine diphosphatase [Gemmatimonadales bacterium]